MAFSPDSPGGQYSAHPDDPPGFTAAGRETSEQASALFSAAIDLLSRREHSCHELRQKLAAKFPEADFEAVLQRLQSLNYQSDQRFAEVFARSRVQRGQGPLRIRQELQVRGVSSSLIQDCMTQMEQELDWFELAAEQLRRKFRTPINEALTRNLQHKERARRQRHLAYRGFSSDAINWALQAEY